MPSRKKLKTPPTHRKSNVYTNYLKVVVLTFVMVAVVVAVVISVYKKDLEKAGNTGTSSPALKQYSALPEMVIDPAKQYQATVKMAKGGEFVIELFADKAPLTVNNFVFLARDGYFDGVTFHRVLEGFMAQTGDPTGTGSGGPGYTFANEDSDLVFDKEGVVAMANAGRDTNGSQFFITFASAEHLNGDFTIFGQVISGMDVVQGITLRNPQNNPSFMGDVIESIIINET